MRQIMDGNNIVIRKYPNQHYTTVFNQENGFFLRLEDQGCDEPFWAESGPELLDISITNYCDKNCSFCYRNSSNNGKHMLMQDIQKIICEAEDMGVLQIALGGGNPNQHPNFIEILKLIRGHNIIPSYTSNGDFLTTEILEATEKYCGAIAVSAYPPFDNSFEDKIKKLSKYNIKVNIHFLIKNDTIDLAIKWLKKPPSFLRYINAIIFLNYKPINSSKSLQVNNFHQVSEFFKCVQECKSLKIGFDSCSISGIVKHMNINSAMIESCEAARFSAFISEDMKMYPCSFMSNSTNYGDLSNCSIKEIWKDNKYFTQYRDAISKNQCKECKHSGLCNGGCQFLPEINFCDNNVCYNEI